MSKPVELVAFIDDLEPATLSSEFSHTWCALRARGFLSSTAKLLSVMLLLGSWLLWAFCARLVLTEVTRDARLEIAAETHPVQSPVSGQLASVTSQIGQGVEAGDILLKLENASQLLALAEQRARLTAVRTDLDALRTEADVRRLEFESHDKASEIAIRQAQERIHEANAPATFAEQDLQRLRLLRQEGLIADREVEKGGTEADRLRSIGHSTVIEVERLASEKEIKLREYNVALHSLQERIAALEGQRQILMATIPSLEHDVEQRLIRAPVAGIIGETASLTPGAYVTQGERVATVVPSGALRIVSRFATANALGRIRKGQLARMRLDGFPWAEYGILHARVTEIASEDREGAVRVELALLQSPDPRLPLLHGLPGSVEVEVESVTPASLLLRSLGRSSTTPVSSSGVH